MSFSFADKAYEQAIRRFKIVEVNVGTVQAMEAERAKWAGEQRKQGRGKGGDKASKAEAERSRAREIAEAEEAVARCALLPSLPHHTNAHEASKISNVQAPFILPHVMHLDCNSCGSQ